MRTVASWCIAVGRLWVPLVPKGNYVQVPLVPKGNYVQVPLVPKGNYVQVPSMPVVQVPCMPA